MLLFFLLGSNCQTRESMHCGCWHSDRYVAIAMEEIFVACWNPILQDIRCVQDGITVETRGVYWELLLHLIFTSPKNMLFIVFEWKTIFFEKRLARCLRIRYLLCLIDGFLVEIEGLRFCEINTTRRIYLMVYI